MQKLTNIAAAFTNVMLCKLANQYDEKKNSYEDMQAEELANKLEQKWFQLDVALYSKQPPEQVAELAADIANYAMLTAAKYYQQYEK